MRWNEGDRVFRFTAAGIPRPKGSHEHVGKGVLTESKTQRAWYRLVAAAARRYGELVGEPPRLAVPVYARLSFRIPATDGADPDYAATSGRFGDLDKLVRGVLDAVSGGTDWGYPVVEDDRNFVAIFAEKYAVRRADRVPPGVDVTIGLAVRSDG